MNKKDVKIKDNITFQDELNAIDYIVSSNFSINNEGEMTYTPEYSMPAEIEAMVMYFLDGISFDNNEIKYDSIMNDKDLIYLVKKFYTSENTKTNKNNQQYITIRNFVMNNAQKKIEFIVQKLIHTHSVENELVDMINMITNVISNFDMSKFKDIDINIITKCMKKIADSDVKITEDYLMKIFKNSVQLDNKASKILDSKNKEIEILKLKIKQLENGATYE